MVTVKKLPIRIGPSAERTLMRPFIPGNPAQVEHILFRILSTTAEEREKAMKDVSDRLDIPEEMRKSVLIRNYGQVRSRIPSNLKKSDDLKEFIGACFTQQYAFESTALFNPSIVLHPIQDIPGVTRFIMSLRAIGEGHISSITFLEGEIDADLNITIKEKSPVVYEPDRKDHIYEKGLYERKLAELGLQSPQNKLLFQQLPERFTLAQLEKELENFRNLDPSLNESQLLAFRNNILVVALSNFSLSFNNSEISERAIYPASPSQSNGLEDARFVNFVGDDGESIYYATFTAYDGRAIMPELLETTDFKDFKISTLNGPLATNKGMALFPRKINGKYMMMSRHDGESLYIMTSDNPYFWKQAVPLAKPTYTWEIIHIGNCGSPVEIEEGWLVITHGVGPLRTYSLGAMLLDKNEPWKIKGRLSEPLLEPGTEDSDGYVPNVLYTCGYMVLGRTLILPYAVADLFTTFALISVDDILQNMKK